MAVSLVKGGNVSLTKEAPTMSGYGWFRMGCPRDRWR